MNPFWCSVSIYIKKGRSIDLKMSIIYKFESKIKHVIEKVIKTNNFVL
ncbi:hypothetical protein bcere0024_031000 [Bacillus cereus Rock4-18]|nr:hypothetical protein bcere0024_031000 [Bacillus cereus Rock4-18]